MRTLVNQNSKKNKPTALQLRWNVGQKAYQVTKELAKLRLFYYPKNEDGEVNTNPQGIDVFVPMWVVDKLKQKSFVEIQCTLSTRRRSFYVKKGRRYKEVNELQSLFLMRQITVLHEKEDAPAVEMVYKESLQTVEA